MTTTVLVRKFEESFYFFLLVACLFLPTTICTQWALLFITIEKYASFLLQNLDSNNCNKLKLNE